MRLGVHFMRFDSAAPADMRRELGDAASYADDAGVAWVSVMDHYWQMMRAGFPKSDPMLEGYTTLGFLAGRTENVQLGTLVTGVTYRYPGLLAKIVASLDVLSGGRATYGIGAAWYEEEHRALGVPYPPLSERFEMLEEAVQIARQMYDPENDGPFEGKHFQLAETLCSPLPLSKPEIMIGGSGERKTLRLVAQYADACNLFAATPDELRHKLDVLHRHCEDVGRDPAEIRVTTLAGSEKLIDGDVAGFVDDMRPFAELGVDMVILRPPATSLAAWVRDAVAPGVPAVAELGA
ncbi:LLM class F420-dependent oxidoreductase [Luteimicrobium subarcticum]|uniref:F420-dependent oxidoreductase-like protein n=1 Tax=Luteimicrobium subarcticum TaxID=620910 RepID=A0A2M8WJ53_9MICO|nr:LLM class F420-dependent oxidoreductase [Luteimicrobium subarcticum]PJI90952.1 F420-dependent oxidoreductase-like protein [Luteimicrobium subarcticum]